MADAGDGESPAQQAQTVAVSDVGKFAGYMRRAVLFLLEDTEDTPEAFAAALDERAVVDCMRRFLADSQVPVLLVQRLSVKGSCIFVVMCFASEITYTVGRGVKSVTVQTSSATPDLLLIQENLFC